VVFDLVLQDEAGARLRVWVAVSWWQRLYRARVRRSAVSGVEPDAHGAAGVMSPLDIQPNLRGMVLGERDFAEVAFAVAWVASSGRCQTKKREGRTHTDVITVPSHTKAQPEDCPRMICPEQWERWWLCVTRRAIAANRLVHHGRPGPPAMTRPAWNTHPASTSRKPASAGTRHFNQRRPRGLLEPCAGTDRTHGSERQRAPATRPANRCHASPGSNAAMACTSPAWSSLVTRATPDRPRAVRPAGTASHPAPSSELASMPRISRSPPGFRDSPAVCTYIRVSPRMYRDALFCQVHPCREDIDLGQSTGLGACPGVQHVC